MGQNTHVPGEETNLPRHALPKRIGFLDATTGLARTVSEAHPLPTLSRGTTSTFGELVVTQIEPRVQLDAVYGIRATDVETFVGAASGTVSAASSLWNCTTGVGVGGYGVIRSKRAVRYRPGLGARFRFTAAFTAGVALSIQWAGVFSSVDYLGFGFNGTSFGITRRVPGALEIRTLTLTAQATGAETGTITLDGTAFAIAITNVSIANNVRELVAGFSSTAWEAYGTEDQIVFVALDAAAKTGAFSYASTGASAGSMTQEVVGSANDNATGHVAQADFNLDTISWLDPLGLNIYEIEFGYLGSANTRFRVYNPTSGKFVSAHQITYGNDAAEVSVNVDNPTLKVGYIAASLGSTTDLSVRGSSMFGGVEGILRPMRNSRAAVASIGSVQTAVNILTIRNAREFNGQLNQQEVLPRFADVAVSGSKPAEVRIYANAAVAAATALWTFEEEDVSIVELCVTKTTTSGGRLVAAGAVLGTGSLHFDLHQLALVLSPKETLSIVVFVSGGAGSDVTASLTWIED